MNNKLRRALIDKTLTLGAWLQIGHPASAELLARAGFDWVCVDLEHGAIGLETMTNIFRALGTFDCAPVARLPLNDPTWIHRTLDAGARALIIPMVKTAEEAKNAVREAKYPPHGTRGFGFSRANMHGIDFSDYTSTANDEIAMIMQIEHHEAIANLDEILAVEGIDGLFIGPYDLSGSMGITGQFDHPRMTEALDTFLASCREHGMAAGTHVVQPDETSVARAIQDGYTLIALGIDTLYLYNGAAAAIRSARGTVQ